MQRILLERETWGLKKKAIKNLYSFSSKVVLVSSGEKMRIAGFDNTRVLLLSKNGRVFSKGVHLMVQQKKESKQKRRIEWEKIYMAVADS